MYRDKERKQGSLSRKKRRECFEYREKERQLELRLKRLARSYPRFKLKERLKGLKSKQRFRRNKYFLELERLKKQHRKRSRDKERISDKKRKRSNRANFFYKFYKAREHDSAMKRKYGSTVENCIELFHSSTSTGPIYVCSCCHQTWFSESMTKVESLTSNVSFQPGILTGMKSVQEWICRTCLSNIKKNKIPKLSVLNGMKWPNKPTQINLHPLEE